MKEVKIYIIRPVSPSFIVKIFCYICSPFIRQQSAQKNAEDASVMIKGLHVYQRILTRNNEKVYLTYFILISFIHSIGYNPTPALF